MTTITLIKRRTHLITNKINLMTVSRIKLTTNKTRPDYKRNLIKKQDKCDGKTKEM